MTVRAWVLGILVAVGLAGVIELISGAHVRPSTPAETWTRTAPEHLGLRYEKIDRELRESQPEAYATAIGRLGYLVWERGETGRAFTLPDPVAQAMNGLQGIGGAAALAEALAFESEVPGTASARDLLRLGLLVLQDGEWAGRQLVDRKAMSRQIHDADVWQSGTTRRGNKRFLALGDRSACLLVLVPGDQTALVAVAQQNKPLPDPAFYADLLSVAYRPVW